MIMWLIIAINGVKRTFYILWLENDLMVHHQNTLMATPNWERQLKKNQNYTHDLFQIAYFNEFFACMINAINRCLLIFKVDNI